MWIVKALLDAGFEVILMHISLKKKKKKTDKKLITNYIALWFNLFDLFSIRWNSKDLTRNITKLTLKYGLTKLLIPHSLGGYLTQATNTTYDKGLSWLILLRNQIQVLWRGPRAMMSLQPPQKCICHPISQSYRFLCIPHSGCIFKRFCSLNQIPDNQVTLQKSQLNHKK